MCMNKTVLKTGKVLMILVIISFFGVVKVFASEQSEQIDERILVGSNSRQDKLFEQISKCVDNNTTVEFEESYDCGILRIHIRGKKDIKEIMKEIDKISGVEFVQLDNKINCTSNEESLFSIKDYTYYQWGLHNTGQLFGDYGKEGIDINILPAWKITEGSSDVTVGIMDSGIDIDHDDLKHSIYKNTNEIPENGVDDDGNGFIDDVNGWNFVDDNNIVYSNKDEDIHGTFVAGIIAACKNDFGVSGVAPNVKIMPLKIIKGTNGRTSDVIKAIEYAKRMRVDIINCSWSSYEYNKALKKAMKQSKLLFVCSTNNDGICTDVKEDYPACFNINNIISVGSIDNKGQAASFSNYGSKVDLMAPGVNIMSTIPESNYYFASGNSFAAPFVTGIAALIKSEYKDSDYKVIKKAIIKKVTTEDELQGKANTSGRVNAYNAIQYIVDKYK